MNSRACLLIALLVSPAWSQEPVADAPVLRTKSFDLNNDSIKKIVRDTAATKFAYVQLSDRAAIEPEPVGIKFVPPEPKLASKPQDVPRLLPDPPSGGFLSALIDVLLGDDDYSAAVHSDKWLRCESRAALKTTQMGYDTCPAKNRDILSVPSD